MPVLNWHPIGTRSHGSLAFDVASIAVAAIKSVFSNKWALVVKVTTGDPWATRRLIVRTSRLLSVTESGRPAAIDHDLDAIANAFVEWGRESDVPSAPT